MNHLRVRNLTGSAARAIVALLPSVAVLAGPGLVRPADAHPSVSLVEDSRGNLYFSDLENVRMLRPDGSMEILLAGVHTHELWLGPGDVLYGEDVTNVGEEYRHRVWRLEPDGSVRDVIPWRDGFPEDFHDFGFARDAAGNMYVLRRDSRSVEVRDAEGSLDRSVELDGGGGFVHWLTVAPDGRVHVAVGGDLLRIDPGSDRAQIVATELVERTAEFDWVHDRHALMGMWADAQGSVYLSVFAGQVVKKVTGSGQASIIARSEGAWSPVGGRSRPDGGLVLLEWSNSNQVRIREIGTTGAERIFPVE